MGPLAPKLELLDDHGKPLAPLGQWDRLKGLWHDRKIPRAVWARWAAPWLWIGVVVLLFAYSRGWPTVTVGDVVYVLVMVVLMHGVHWVSVWRRTSWLWRAAWAPVAWLSAYRVCGACGYGLAEVGPGEDGVAICPECGAGWHRDRWTLEGRDPREEPELVRVLEGRGLGGTAMRTDDRGVPLGPISGWRPRWTGEDWVPAEARQDIGRRLGAAARRRLLAAAGIGLVLWPLGTWLGVWWDDPLPRDYWTSATLIAVYGGVMYGLLMFLVSRVAVGGATVRAAALAVGRCPNCGEAMAEGPVGFDGCVACGRCRRAWRRG